jgi:hypothetical protein
MAFNIDDLINELTGGEDAPAAAITVDGEGATTKSKSGF